MSYSCESAGRAGSAFTTRWAAKETFDKLTRRFYALVKADPEFSAMYPDFDPFPPDHLTEEQTAEIEANDTRPLRCTARRLKNVPDSVLLVGPAPTRNSAPPAFAHPP